MALVKVPCPERRPSNHSPIYRSPEVPKVVGEAGTSSKSIMRKPLWTPNRTWNQYPKPLFINTYTYLRVYIYKYIYILWMNSFPTSFICLLIPGSIQFCHPLLPVGIRLREPKVQRWEGNIPIGEPLVARSAGCGQPYLAEVTAGAIRVKRLWGGSPGDTCGRVPPIFGSDRGATGFTLVAEPLAEFWARGIRGKLPGAGLIICGFDSNTRAFNQVIHAFW